jgi:hypothetical protein
MESRAVRSKPHHFDLNVAVQQAVSALRLEALLG